MKPIPDNLLEQALELLKKPGTVLLIPTETVYGLVCDWSDDPARERIYQLKQRDERKPLAMFAASTAMAAAAGVNFNNEAEKLLAEFAPGPITVIAPGCERYPTIGVRIPDHPFVLELLRRYGRPLASTSANASGRPNVLDPRDALAELSGPVDLVVDGGILPIDAAASTVVSVCETPCRILRQGPITQVAINQLLYSNK
ncbi:MAG: threonylcarbamoyl-AMP synthase [Lentisphaerae bacterium]|nr:threonylcarbamoyl-AMP synthase [Lentisphaerota bacterium]